MTAWWRHNSGQVTQARISCSDIPVVVIDPEDREQVERLENLYLADKYDGDLDTTTSFQAALREFANPTPPKHEEPTGLGAVVEDKRGAQWVRVGDTGCDDWRKAGYGGGSNGRWYRYDDFDAVTVLSPGVTD